MSIRSFDRKESLRMSFKSESTNELDEISEDNSDTSCGFGSCQPECLQKFNTPKSFLVNNGLLGLLNGATFTYFIGCISTLEKRYAFESKVTGVIMIAEEISPICFGFLIGYFGGNSHRPKFMATAMMVGFLSSFVMASPYFLYGPIREISALDHYANWTDFELCDMKEKNYFCDMYPTMAAVSILVTGTFMKGFAVTAFNTIGLPYLDDNVKKKNTAMYFGIDRKESLAMGLRAATEEELVECLEDVYCGIGSFHPKWLQKFNSPKVFLVINGLLGLLNSAAFCYFIGCISTLEKRYGLETKITGIIMIAEEISPICFGVAIGYFGGKYHRPRVMAWAMVIAFLSNFIMASPYFLYGRMTSTLKLYTNKTDFELCDMEEKDYECDNFPVITVVSILFLATFIKGLSGVAFYTVGTTYLDDNIKKKNTAMYFATSMIIQLLGPASGFLLSSLCLQFYEDPFFDPGYGTDDPRWIGAWWLGYVIIGILMFIFAIPMWFFPRRFPGVKIPKTVQKKGENQKSAWVHLKGMGNAVKRLIKNPILVCHQLGGILRVNGLIGYFVLMPKYMEMQFKQSASKANLFSGPVSLFGMMIGIFIGGVAVRRFKPRARILTGGIVFAESFSVLALLICMQISCPSFQWDQTNLTANPLLDLENDCNRDCLCTTDSYTPVCGPDGKSTYFSPCHAGCVSYNKTGKDDEDESEIYTNCKCVHNSVGEFTIGDATKSYCSFECQWLIIYILVLSLGKFMSATTSVPNTLVTLRCVDPADKSVALGALSGVYSILAFIPYPLVYGALSDSCCLVWEKSCGRTGNCWIYDVDKFRYMLHGVSCIFIALGSVTDICVCILSTRLKNLYDDDKPEGGNELKPPSDSEKSVVEKETLNDDRTKADQNISEDSDIDQKNGLIRINEENKDMEISRI